MVRRSATSCLTIGKDRTISGDCSRAFSSRYGVNNLASLGIGPGHVDLEPCLPFCGQSRCVDCLRGSKSNPGVSEVDRDRHLVQADVGGSELGVVVVAPITDLLGHGASITEEAVRLIGQVQPSGGDRPLQRERTPQRHRLDLPGFREGLQSVSRTARRLRRLLEVARTEEDDGEPEFAGCHQQRITGSLGGDNGTVNGDPAASGSPRFASAPLHV